MRRFIPDYDDGSPRRKDAGNMGPKIILMPLQDDAGHTPVDAVLLAGYFDDKEKWRLE